MTFTNHADGSESHAVNQPTLVFVGHVLSFTDHLMRMVASELSDVGILRCDTPAEFQAQVSRDGHLIVAAIIDENLRTDLVAFAAMLREAAPHANLGLAYRDDGIPAEIFGSIQGNQALQKLSLLPMRLQSDSWLAIVRLIANGEGYLPNSILNSAPQQPAARSETLAVDLTPRELEVLELVSRGQQNKTIANALSLSEHTIKLHLHHIIGKLGVRNRTEATVWYMANIAPGRPHG